MPPVLYRLHLSRGLALAAGLIFLSAASPTNAQVSRCGARTFSVYFEQFKDRLDLDAKRALRVAQRSFTGCTIESARVIGSAGSPGDPDSNLALSQRRSRLVADMLVVGGWPRSSMEVNAVGDRGAKIGDEERPLRRRVQVEVHARPGS